ncbi:MAG: hypothetical protein ACFFF4_06025 [Candidatus Thorarchaeota archaeon]
MSSVAGKPIGIVILAILQLLSALFYLASGALIIIATLPLGIFAIFGAFVGLIFLIVGIIGLILFYGLWNLKGWAWLWTLIINILGVLGAIGNPIGNIIGLAISIIIIIYLFVPSTRAAFK